MGCSVLPASVEARKRTLPLCPRPRPTAQLKQSDDSQSDAACSSVPRRTEAQRSCFTLDSEEDGAASDTTASLAPPSRERDAEPLRRPDSVHAKVALHPSRHVRTDTAEGFVAQQMTRLESTLADCFTTALSLRRELGLSVPLLQPPPNESDVRRLQFTVSVLELRVALLQEYETQVNLLQKRLLSVSRSFYALSLAAITLSGAATVYFLVFLARQI